MGHRGLPEPRRRGLRVWRGRLAHRPATVDLLLRADLLLRRGVHTAGRDALGHGGGCRPDGAALGGFPAAPRRLRPVFCFV
ncbi:hypothetical protein G6F24_018507 [Rhizopus arrhizus]|nr:hypothetical protein G6F24_018507 [Rhizopus arrhizus]